ncbi:uncharacterized protein N7529_000395 [Penicillium soppii]|uniref:uncharacterized protein n=1 Tax=Penicillium soppii TaxID=69789 RepID=UPI002546A744|nr:uncharacterized protein N7529_000395 [Penicillium soppii]KAJ5881723.1 hypothetical protein N7529_000395 [Penicillium soppii]
MTVRNSKGDEGGPLPGISGPFGTAAVLFEAWADSVKLKLDREEIAAVMPRTSFPAERTVSIIENFPLQIKR